MRIGNCAFAISFVALTGLLAAGAADAQPAPPAGGSAQPQPTTSTKLVEGKHSQNRRATNRAARKFFKAQKDLYDSLCKSETAQRDAQEALTKAEKELDDAIAREVDEAPDVKAATLEAQRAFRAWLEAAEGTPEYNRLLHEQVEKHERALELRRKETARIKARIVEISDTPQPRQTSCGPGVPNTVSSMSQNAGLRLSMGGDYTLVNLPIINAGTRISGGVESPIASSARRLEGGGGSVQARHWIGDMAAEYFASHRRANASSFGFVSPGAEGVAQTYIYANPVSGSTGINAGATGQSVTTETKWSEFAGAIVIKTEIPVSPATQVSRLGLPLVNERLPPDFKWEFGAGVHYRNTQRTDTITQQSVNFAGLSSVTDLSTVLNFIAPHLTAGFVVAPVGRSGPIAGLNGFVAPGFNFTSARATQNSRCTPCGGGSPENSVMLQRDFSENKFAMISGVSGYVGYQVGPNFQLKFEASYEHQTGMPVFVMPTTPTQQPITLGSGSVDTFRFGGRLVFNFPPPPPP